MTGSQVSVHSDTRLRVQTEVTQLTSGSSEEGKFTSPRHMGEDFFWDAVVLAGVKDRAGSET